MNPCRYDSWDNNIGTQVDLFGRTPARPADSNSVSMLRASVIPAEEDETDAGCAGALSRIERCDRRAKARDLSGTASEQLIFLDAMGRSTRLVAIFVVTRQTAFSPLRRRRQYSAPKSHCLLCGGKFGSHGGGLPAWEGTNCCPVNRCIRFRGRYWR